MHFYFDWSNGTRMLLVLVFAGPCIVYYLFREHRIREKLKIKFPNIEFPARSSVLGCWPFGRQIYDVMEYAPRITEAIIEIRETEGRPCKYFWIGWLLGSLFVLI